MTTCGTAGCPHICRVVNVLITGGAGFLGAHLAEALLLEGHRVTIFDNLSRSDAADAARVLNARFDRTGRLSFVFRDVRHAREVERAVEGMDAVFHGAGFESEESALLDPREDFSTRVSGTFNLLEAMRCHAPLAHLVLASSAAVYGPPPIVRGVATFAASERQPLAPETPFASGAACAEKYALAYARAYGLRVTVFRLANVYGNEPAFASADGWLPRLVAAAHGGFAIAPPTDPRWPVDLLHVEDVGRVALAAWEDPAPCIGQVFNLGGGAHNAPSLWEIAEHLGSIGGRLSLLPPIHNARPSFVLDCTRIREALGWKPFIEWPDGLERVYAMAGGLPELDDVHPLGASLAGAGNQELPPLESGGLVAWPRAEGQA